jgi:hypothetical protein
MLLRFLVVSSLCLTSLAAAPAVANPTVQVAGANISGRWYIHQRNANNAEYTGELRLGQHGNTIEGQVIWSNHAAGRISGYIKDHQVFFKVYYPGGLVGNYHAYIDRNSGNFLSEGGGYDNLGAQTCMWSARRL